MKKVFLFLLLFSLVLAASAQNNGYLSNPSFEDYPRPGKAPKKWFDCGFKGETPPDVQPDGTFAVITEAYDGDSYLGLVVRDNDTWEAVTQELLKPLEKDRTYEFNLFLARSELYISVSRVTEETANYAEPVIFRLYGGNTPCAAGQLLGETGPIINHQWEKHTLAFKAKADWKYLKLEAYFAPDLGKPYNGNLLLDNCLLFLKDEE